MTTLAHALFGIALTLATWRALTQDWPDQLGDPAVASALRVLIPFAAAAGSALSIVGGRLGGDPARSFRHDALSALGLFAGLAFIALGPAPRDALGLAAMVILAVRLAPAAWWTIRFGAPPLFVFALCLCAYSGIATWRVAASLPLGDQVFYLLAAERLKQGDLDATMTLRGSWTSCASRPALGRSDACRRQPRRPAADPGLPALRALARGWIVAGELGATTRHRRGSRRGPRCRPVLLGETVPIRAPRG